MVSNVLVGVPDGCPAQIAKELERCIEKACIDVGIIKTVMDVTEFLQELKSRGVYQIVIAVDALGVNAMYVPYLNAVQKNDPDLNVVVVVPNDRHGTEHMTKLLEQGLFNGLYQSDLSGDNIVSLVKSPRKMKDAALYYGVGALDADEKSVRTLRDGITVTRGFARDFVKDVQSEDDELLDYLDSAGWGMDHTGTEPTELMVFPLEEEWVQTYKKALKNYFRGNGIADLQAFENDVYTEEDFRNVVTKKTREMKIPLEREKDVVDSFIRDLVSYGKLDVVLNTEDVSDIKLNSKDSVTVQCKGKWYNTNITFESDDEFSYFINKVCSKNSTGVNAAQTQVVFSDIKTNPYSRLRISVSHSSINTNGQLSASIRKISKLKKLATELVNEGFWTKEQAGFLINAMRKGKSIIVCGGSGCGKTIEVNCMIEYVPDNIPGVCIQEAEELHADKKVNMEFQHSIAATGESKINVTMKELATQGLLKNAKLFIIGEIKGAEAEDFMTAANTGAQVVCTTHSNSAFDALERIADLGRGAGYSQEQMLRMLSRNIDFVVYNENYGVHTIAGVVGWDEVRKEVIYDVYDFQD